MRARIVAAMIAGAAAGAMAMAMAAVTAMAMAIVMATAAAAHADERSTREARTDERSTREARTDGRSTSEARTDGRSTSAALAKHLASRANDRAIRADVMAWHHTMRNGCVAYASTALRHVGVDIGERDVIDGDGVSRLTRGFVRWLEDGAGWRRITEPKELAPGDLLFTTDAPSAPGYPAHVFVFLGWKDAKRLVARIADNTGYRKVRSLTAGGSRDGFAFALRSPAR